MDPEQLVEAGQMLVQLGRTIQRHFPPPNKVGCQFDEWPILKKLLPGDNGLYIDIGAHHPSDCSNTYEFYKRGWHGLLIEPHPDAWPGLLLERPRDFVCPVACSNYEGWATLNLCRSVSSLDPAWRTDNDGTIPVPAWKLSSLLETVYSAASCGVDFLHKTNLLSIDVEGWERQVIEGIDWRNFRPAVVIIEYADQNGVDISSPWRGILEANYVLHFSNKLNQIWKRK